MLRKPAFALLSAAALLSLEGCTLHINSQPNQPTATRAPAARTTQRSGMTLRRTPARATTAPATTQPTSHAAPVITSTIAFGNGRGGAFTGQAYVISAGSKKLPNLDTLIPFATLYTDSFQVSSQEFASGFPGALKQDDWFAIRYDGKIAVPIDGEYEFELVSDDGANLYIDGQKVIDNDGVHAATTAKGKKQLKAGQHTLRLDYFQGERGQVALALSVVVQGQRKAPVIGVR